MKNETISIKFSAEKLSALKIYLNQKDTSVEAELEKVLDGMYVKTVPAMVRDYIEIRSQMPAGTDNPGRRISRQKSNTGVEKDDEHERSADGE